MKELLVAKAIAGFQAAAIDGLPWMDAVEALTAATGSRSGELIGLGLKCVVPFNLMSGADSAVNSRVRVGARTADWRSATRRISPRLPMCGGILPTATG